MSENTQKKFPKLEQSKWAVFTILKALFQDAFDMEDEEFGDFRQEVAEYIENNRVGYWLNVNLLVTDKFLDWMFEVFPYFYVALLTRPAFVNYLFKAMYESEKNNDKTVLYEVNPVFIDKYFTVGQDGVYQVDFFKYNETLYQLFQDKIKAGVGMLEPMNGILGMCSGMLSEMLQHMLRYIAGHFLELLFLLMHDRKVYAFVALTIKNVKMEINDIYGPLEKE